MYDLWEKQDGLRMDGNVKGVVGSSEDEVVEKLKLAVTEYVNRFWYVQDGKMKLSDFNYTFAVSKSDEDGYIWATTCVVRYQDL